MPYLTTLKKIFFAVLLVSAVSLLFDLPAPFKTVFGLLQAFYLPGFTFLLFMGDERRPRLDNIFIPLLLSPAILVLLVLAVHALSGSFHTSLRVSLVITYILFAVALLTRRGRGAGEPATVPAGILLVSISFCSIIIASYLVNDFLFYHDTCRHSSIANEIIYRGLPPMEPFFVDIPIRSMWFQHLFQAIWKELSGLSIFHSMWLFNLVSAFTFPYLIARITSLFTSKRKYILCAPVFAIAGLDAAGWVLLPLKLTSALFGEVRGMAEIARLFSAANLNSRYVLNLLAAPHTFIMNLLDKYLTIDVHHYSLNLFLLCFILVISIDFQKRAGFKAFANILLVMSGAWMFRIINGVALVLTVILAGLITFLFNRIKRDQKKPTYRSAIIPAIAVIVGAVGLVYYKRMTGEYTDGLFVPNRLSLNLTSLITIVSPLIVLLPFSVRALKWIFTSGKKEVDTFAAWILSLFILSVSMDLRGTLENYFIYPLFMLLIIPVSYRIISRLETVRGTRSIALAVWVVILFLVPPVLTVRGYMLEKPHSKHVMRRCQITEDERKIYDWIRDNTGIEAVIVEKNEYNVMPYYAYRRNFYMTSWEILNFGYKGEKVEKYKSIRDEIYADEPISRETIETLRNFEYEIFVVVWGEDLIGKPDLNGKFVSRPEWFEKVYENPAGTVYALKE